VLFDGEIQPCADGTAYILGLHGRVFWLVSGKAVEVPCSDQFSTFALGALSDSKGGLYAQGVSHVWYLKDGTATQVRQTSRNDVAAEEHRVTNGTRFWSILHAFGRSAYEAGLDAGWGQGYGEGYNDGQAQE